MLNWEFLKRNESNHPFDCVVRSFVFIILRQEIRHLFHSVTYSWSLEVLSFIYIILREDILCTIVHASWLRYCNCLINVWTSQCAISKFSSAFTVFLIYFFFISYLLINFTSICFSYLVFDKFIVKCYWSAYPINFFGDISESENIFSIIVKVTGLSVSQRDSLPRTVTPDFSNCQSWTWKLCLPQQREEDGEKPSCGKRTRIKAGNRKESNANT